ncbi:SNAP receptor [Rhizophlyctis rosea]|uniref:Protein transport protein SEC22 n=1 Tax=Rhizophlyctis rosea TaxID=64517 RepID=A0AAD5SDN0_9FUNG|nr:SNAP receptor [Rhizophlyctis rosea]
MNMIRFTLIARTGDGLPLVATMESQKEEDVIARHKKLSKGIIATLSPEYRGVAMPAECTVTADEFSFHYMTSSGVVFLVLCDKSYPRLLAFSYLNEVTRGFFDELKATSTPIHSVHRPYSFIRFEPSLQSIKKRYINTRQLRTQEDLVDLSARIQSVDILDVRDVLSDDYLIAASMKRKPFAQSVSVKELTQAAYNVANVLKTEIGEAKGTPESQQRRSALLVWLSLIICVVDSLYLVFYWTRWEAPNNMIRDISTGRRSDPNAFETLSFLLLGLMTPIILVQAYHFNLQSHLPDRLANLSLAHWSLTVLQTIWALVCRNNVPPPGSTANRVYQSGLQRAAAWFGKWCMPLPIVLVKVVYIVLIGFAVGMGARRRWKRFKPSGLKD